MGGGWGSGLLQAVDSLFSPQVQVSTLAADNERLKVGRTPLSRRTQESEPKVQTNILNVIGKRIDLCLFEMRGYYSGYEEALLRQGAVPFTKGRQAFLES